MDLAKALNKNLGKNNKEDMLVSVVSSLLGYILSTRGRKKKNSLTDAIHRSLLDDKEKKRKNKYSTATYGTHG